MSAAKRLCVAVSLGTILIAAAPALAGKPVALLPGGRTLANGSGRLADGRTAFVFKPGSIFDVCMTVRNTGKKPIAYGFTLDLNPPTLFVPWLAPGKTQTLCQDGQDEQGHIQCNTGEPKSKPGGDCTYEWRIDRM